VHTLLSTPFLSISYTTTLFEETTAPFLFLTSPFEDFYIKGGRKIFHCAISQLSLTRHGKRRKKDREKGTQGKTLHPWMSVFGINAISLESRIQKAGAAFATIF